MLTETIAKTDLGEVYDIFATIQETAGKNDKIQVIKNNADNELFKFFLNFLYNDMITTGLSAKKISKDLKRTGLRTVRGFETPIDVMNHVSTFNTGSDGIIDDVQLYLKQLEEPQQSFMREVLTKSYKCGITSTSVNKAIPNLITEFKVMLAHPYEKYADKIKTVKNIERRSVTYFCDIYLYEPQEERDIR